MITIRCNNCETLYEEYEINIVQCTECKTDQYLMQLESEQDNEE